MERRRFNRLTRSALFLFWIAACQDSVEPNPGPPAVQPPAPSNLVVVASSATKLVLTWNDNASSEAGFQIERCTGAACSGFAELATVAANTVQYTDTGLSAATSYSYRVRASTGAEPSGYSNVATTATFARPAPPGGLVATAVSSTRIDLTWSDDATNETGFRLERCANAGCSNFTVIATVGANTERYSDTGLATATSFRYRARAFNATDTSAYSNTATIATFAAERLADLGMDRVSDLQIEVKSGRKLLRFSTTIVNVGAGPFEARGQRSSSTDSLMKLTHRIYDAAGGWRDTPMPAVLEYSGDGHDHWHVRGLQLSQLFRPDGTYLVRSSKQGFCFWDNAEYRLELPGAPPQPAYHRPGCGNQTSVTVAMGLSPGWGDTYSYSLAHQFVDVSGLPDGPYRLVVTADAGKEFREADEDNNQTWVDVELYNSGQAVRVLAWGPSAVIGLGAPVRVREHH